MAANNVDNLMPIYSGLQYLELAHMTENFLGYSERSGRMKTFSEPEIQSANHV